MKGRVLNQSQNNPTASDRYARQIRFPSIGETGQATLGDSTALVVGCGALGSVIANTLARSGVGRLRIVDRDFLEYSNLQRQVLYDEQDVKNGLPKAIAAADKIAKINSTIDVEPVVLDVDASNVESLCEGVDVILDGSDNFEIRFLLNDVSVKHSIPWVYGGCLGADGQTMTVLPKETACLNCLMLDGPPPPGTSPTCDSFGILSPVINLIASLQSMEALKILSGNRKAISRQLTVASMWESELRQIDISGLRDKVDCPTCCRGEFRWLSGERESHSVVLCGRDAVQVSFPGREQISLVQMAERLETLGRLEANAFLLRFHIDEYVISVFPDGRAIISGTEDLSLARKLYTQYLGS